MEEIFDPISNANPRGNQVGRSNEALRLAYTLLWNFAVRLAEGNPEKLDESHYLHLLSFLQVKVSSTETPESNYQKLMIDVHEELNFFVNGAVFDEITNFGGCDLGIRDSDYLDALAEVLQDYDGIVGYILAGNIYASEKLLARLAESDFKLLSRGSSTRERALETLKNQAIEL